MSDEIKQIAALIGHHQALEKRVTSLTEQFQAASSQLQQQSETLSRVIRELDSASGNSGLRSNGTKTYAKDICH